MQRAIKHRAIVPITPDIQISLGLPNLAILTIFSLKNGVAKFIIKKFSLSITNKGY